jgi:pyrimidine-nucleoside phosphorylase
MLLGAGRATKDDIIDFDAGITLVKKTGDRVEEGDVLALLHTSDESKVRAAEEAFLAAYTFSAEEPERIPLVYKILN